MCCVLRERLLSDQVDDRIWAAGEILAEVGDRIQLAVSSLVNWISLSILDKGSDEACLRAILQTTWDMLQFLKTKVRAPQDFLQIMIFISTNLRTEHALSFAIHPSRFT